MYSAITATALLASIAAAAPSSNYGNKSGNFMKGYSSVGPTPAAAGGVVTGGAAVTSINNQDGIGAGADSYTFYAGDGSSGAGWPAKEAWVSFEDMFNANKVQMSQSCGNLGYGDNDSDDEIGAIYDGINTVATETAVDHRFILAVIMQESGGCVRAPTSNYGVRNPGLMQDHNGDATCNSDITGEVQNPCPNDTITQMIRDGSAGTADGDGLAQTLNQAQTSTGDSGSRAFYAAARIYNSGSVDASGDLGAGIATHCYSSDIANRLTGWVLAASGCTLDG